MENRRRAIRPVQAGCGAIPPQFSRSKCGGSNLPTLLDRKPCSGSIPAPLSPEGREGAVSDRAFRPPLLVCAGAKRSLDIPGQGCLHGGGRLHKLSTRGFRLGGANSRSAAKPPGS